ncbi:MAG: FkbM family methyltransferase [Planctomycetaceae bacterium]|nr:FkbM family methyltransferase [Planctomycetaceae bacterium]
MKIQSVFKALLRSAVKSLFPRQFWRRRAHFLRQACHEPELRLVPYLCDPQKIAVDIGADVGVFSMQICGVSRKVIAFEPRPRQAAELTAMFSCLELPVEVEEVALSDHAGTAQLRVLTEDAGRSTIEAANSLEDEDGSAKEQITVNVRKLDDYGLNDVAFIKIDVEGHEVSVLGGASETIERCLPFLLIESEDRHRANAVADVTAFLQQRGYSGFFLNDGVLVEMDRFDPSVYQDGRNIGGWKDGWSRKGIYVNNFLFAPAGREAHLREALTRSKS